MSEKLRKFRLILAGLLYIANTCLAKFTIVSYLQSCWEYIYDNGQIDVSTTVLHLCYAHIMHIISYNLERNLK